MKRVLTNPNPKHYCVTDARLRFVSRLPWNVIKYNLKTDLNAIKARDMGKEYFACVETFLVKYFYLFTPIFCQHVESCFQFLPQLFAYALAETFNHLKRFLAISKRAGVGEHRILLCQLQQEECWCGFAGWLEMVCLASKSKVSAKREMRKCLSIIRRESVESSFDKATSW